MADYLWVSMATKPVRCNIMSTGQTVPVLVTAWEGPGDEAILVTAWEGPGDEAILVTVQTQD